MGATGDENGVGVIAVLSYVWFEVIVRVVVGVRGAVSKGGTWFSTAATSACAQGAETAKASNEREKNIKSK